MHLSSPCKGAQTSRPTTTDPAPILGPIFPCSITSKNEPPHPYDVSHSLQSLVQGLDLPIPAQMTWVGANMPYSMLAVFKNWHWEPAPAQCCKNDYVTFAPVCASWECGSWLLQMAIWMFQRLSFIVRLVRTIGGVRPFPYLTKIVSPKLRSPGK